MDTENQKNTVCELYKDSTIFITGGSGFVGKVLIEKILRDLDVKRIYLLMREKRGKSPQERLNILFSNMLYDVLKKKKPESLKKVKIIEGDVMKENLGLSVEDRQTLQNEVEYIIHSAASTRFDDSLYFAAKMNTRGTKYVLDLAKECKKLKCMVHVSTAYAFPKEKVLYERAYDPPCDPQKILDMVNAGIDSKEISEKLLGDCPNTYTFSKACAEALVVKEMDALPVVIIRPSIVCPTIKEPIPGWCNNLQGPMGLLVGAGKGIIRSMYVTGDCYADFIPADGVANGIILSAWYYIKHEKSHRIINCVSASKYNFTWKEIIEVGKDIVYNKMPFNGVVWYPGGSLKSNRFYHNVCFYLLQLLPAIFIDFILIILGYKPILYNIQRRIQKGNEMFEYYTTRQWNFGDYAKEQAQLKMNDVEKKMFYVEPGNFSINDYFAKCVHTVRINNLKETDDMLPAARRHMKVMYVVDKVVKIGFLLFFFYYLYSYLQPILIKS